MIGEKETGTAAQPALKVGGLYKVTNPTNSYFGQVGFLRTVFSGPEAPTGFLPLWIEFTTRSQCDFARDDVEPYESEDTEPRPSKRAPLVWQNGLDGRSGAELRAIRRTATDD